MLPCSLRGQRSIINKPLNILKMKTKSLLFTIGSILLLVTIYLINEFHATGKNETFLWILFFVLFISLFFGAIIVICKKNESKEEKPSVELLRSNFEKTKLNRIENDNFQYGPGGELNECDYVFLKNFIDTFKTCDAEVLASYETSVQESSWYKTRAVNISNAQDALSFFEYLLNGSLKPIFVEKIIFKLLPLKVEYRNRNEKKFVHLHLILADYPPDTYEYDFSIREK